MNKIKAFFKKVEGVFKTIGHDVAKVLELLFGANALKQLETAAETILKSNLGQAVLADAVELLGEVERGQITQESAINQLAAEVASEAKKTGIALESALSTMVASMAIARLTGALNTPIPAAEPPDSATL